MAAAGLVNGLSRRRLGQSGQHGHFGQCQLVRILSVVNLRSRGNAVGAMAKKFLVEIELKNFVLVELALDLEGQQHFTQFASEGVVGRQKETSCNLLGNGAAAGNAALAHAAGIKPDGPQGAATVDAGVLVEAVVFCGQEGTPELCRDLVESDGSAALFT